MRLSELDDRHLPVAAARLRAWLDRAQVRRDRARSAARNWNPAALDARYGGRAPFRVITARPLIALVATGALLAAGVGVAVVREDGGSSAPFSGSDPLPQGDLPRGTILGPQVGDRTKDYAQQATARLVDAVRDAPEEPRVALVSLTDYRTPAQASALLRGFAVSRAFLRAKAAGKQAAALPVDVRGDLLRSLRTAYVQTAKSRAAARKAYQGYVDTLRPDSTQDRAFRDLYAAFARASGIESREYAHDCACVYAVLVTAPPTLLLSLHARPGVRAVELAGPGLTVLQVQVQPLLPEVVGVVPRPSVSGPS